MAARYPLMVDLRRRPVLVVGGGAVATRKVLGLLDAGAQVTVVAPELSAPLAELAGRGLVRWREGRYAGLDRADDGRPWTFVVAATDDAVVNASVVADADRVGTWANDATDPTGGPASLPAVHRDGRLTLAASTDGVHPVVARWACEEAAAALGPEPAIALQLIEELRLADVAAGGRGRRPDWRAAVASGTLDRIRAGQLAEAKERLEACLSSSSD